MQTIGSLFNIAAVSLDAHSITVDGPGSIRTIFKASIWKNIFGADGQFADCLIFLIIQGDHSGDPVISCAVFLCGFDLFRIPCYFSLRRGSVGVSHCHFFRKTYLLPQCNFRICRFHNTDLKLCGCSCFYIFKNIQCIQRMSGEIKQSLIVYRRTTIPFSGILGIVFSRIGCCPAGTVLLPCCPIGLQYFFSICRIGIVDLYRKPCGFPVEYTDTVGGICNGVNNFS